MSPENSKVGLSRSSNQSAEEQENLNKHTFAPKTFGFLGFCCLKGAETCVRVGVVMPAAPNWGGTSGFGAFLRAKEGFGVLDGLGGAAVPRPGHIPANLCPPCAGS